MRVYHVSIYKVEHPDLLHSKPDLDFGQGFYVTTYREQAERWARRKALRSRCLAVLNIFELQDDWSRFRVLSFPSANVEWLDFVCNCRRGGKQWEDFDIIQGPVADDDVYQAVSLYYRGIWDSGRTLQELAFARPSNQIVFHSQEVLNLCLEFLEFQTWEVSL